MSYRIKLPTKKGSGGEEQLLTTMERLMLSAEEHRRGLLAGLGVALLAALVVGGVVWYDYQQSQKAMELHLEANRFYSVRPADKPEQTQKNLKHAIALYRQVTKEYPRSPVAPQSLFRLGLALEQDNQRIDAIEAYEKLVTQYGGTDQLVGLTYQRLAYAYLAKGESAKAQEAFSAVLDVPKAANKDHVVFEMAKMEEAASRPEGALARYQDLVQRYPNSPLANEAGVRIKALEVKEELSAKPEEEEKKD